MKDWKYLLDNFFTHKDYLVPANQIPGTLFTPLHVVFASIIFILVLLSSNYVSKRKKLIKPVLTFIWIFTVLFEIYIITWESLAGPTKVLDLQTNLPLYPCSIFLYTLPFVIWGKGKIKDSACGSICTLGLLGALINFFYPAIRLSSYSCISIVGFHTFYFHGIMLFTCIVLLKSGFYHLPKYNDFKEIFIITIPSLLESIPANIINYSPIEADYMFFTGKFPLFAIFSKNLPTFVVTIIAYIAYLLIPILICFIFYYINKIYNKLA